MEIMELESDTLLVDLAQLLRLDLDRDLARLLRGDLERDLRWLLCLVSRIEDLLSMFSNF